jgi:hypothetical protein
LRGREELRKGSYPHFVRVTLWATATWRGGLRNVQGAVTFTWNLSSWLSRIWQRSCQSTAQEVTWVYFDLKQTHAALKDVMYSDVLLSVTHFCVTCL